MSQSDLFNPAGSQDNLSLHGFGALEYLPGWLDGTTANHYFSCLYNELSWTQPDILIYGEKKRIPRQQVWFGDPDAHMVYSGRDFAPTPWHPLLASLKASIEDVCGQKFNSVLANLYRDGNDSVSWHADDEVELGVNPVIASLSLGATRTFSLKPKAAHLPNSECATVHLPLCHGDLLVMGAKTQTFWHHALLKDKYVKDARINLTFRQIVR